MGWLSWIALGLVAGILAKWIMPGRQGGGCLMTILLGVAGAFIGGWVGTQLGWGTVAAFDLRGLGLAVGGALVLLLLFGLIRKR